MTAFLIVFNTLAVSTVADMVLAANAGTALGFLLDVPNEVYLGLCFLPSAHMASH